MSAEELHIPLHATRADDSQWKVRCSCGAWGPAVSDPSRAKVALAEAHGAREPDGGCALCGLVVPDSGWTYLRHPWQRYRPALGPAGRWEYVCSSSVTCRQRCLAAEHQLVAGEPWMALDATEENTFTVSLDDALTDVLFNLDQAIAMYRVAQEASPRTWDSITSSPGDQRSLTARVVALAALETTASTLRNDAVLCARKAGVTWAHLAGLLDQEAEDLHADHERWYRSRDWPWGHGNVPPEIAEALRADPNT